MSPKENLLRIINQLPEEKVSELERVAISMLEAPGRGSNEARPVNRV